MMNWQMASMPLTPERLDEFQYMVDNEDDAGDAEETASVLKDALQDCLAEITRLRQRVTELGGDPDQVMQTKNKLRILK
jgi:hypothetical protein